MATEEARIEYARVERVLDHDVDTVWAIAGQFGGIDRWVDGVTSCGVVGEGPGSIRTVTRNGNTVLEKLDTCDPATRTLAYTIQDPSPLPATGVQSVLTLDAADPGKTRAVWVSSAATLEVPAEVLGKAIARFYGDSLDGLAVLLRA